MEGGPKQFNSAEEEIAFLRAQLALKEKEMVAKAPETTQEALDSAARQEVQKYATENPAELLSPAQQMSAVEMASGATRVEGAVDGAQEIINIARERGVLNALSVMEKSKGAHTVDDVHARLVELIRQGVSVQDLKEDTPLWRVLHMSLFEVSLPEFSDKNDVKGEMQALVGLMEQFFAGMQNVGTEKQREHYVLEIASPEGRDDIIFYVAVPNQYVDLFDKQIHSLYPNAELILQQHDYNVFVEGGVSSVSVAELKKFPIYPLKTEGSFGDDPLSVLLNAFSKIEKEGGGASIQFVVKRGSGKNHSTYQDIIKKVQKGDSPSDAIKRSTVGGEVLFSIGEMIKNNTAPKKFDQTPEAKDVDQNALEVFNEKIKSPILETNIRIVASAGSEMRVNQILSEIEATFHQFEHTGGNSLVFRREGGSRAAALMKAYSFREFSSKNILPLSIHELATLVHFPGAGIHSSPQFKQSQAKTAPAPTEMPQEGTLLGINKHRGVEKEIFITDKDRLRHFYVIGQTGTGKSVFLKNLIIQDIQAGAGVCMIDPHGTDIADVLASVPPERRKDVIYFDPANLEQVIGLNMLEYDINKPEQKTFVVNELFSIFQRLYGANPESMGPMFEQYFRNATLLVMEDPASGNTLMDISRVMSDANYRAYKLSKATNPVVTQFWNEIASKAGGEASLENIVPYIVSKFDVFTANDYMRPIIGQQHSSFNFRQIMDERKILLVNLSKGRLGEINANLIGMIIVGKILMAALSRVDNIAMDFAPFYLHIDEFQNVTTDSISAILSEARKYKLGLTVAHQFIAQLDEKIRDAVFGNVGSIAAFRVGADDAAVLEHQLNPPFTANDLINIPNYQAYLRVLANGVPTKPFSISTMPPPEVEQGQIAAMVAESLARYGRPRAEVETEIRTRYQQ